LVGFGFFVGDVTKRAVLGYFGPFIGSWAPTQWATCWTHFFGT